MFAIKKEREGRERTMENKSPRLRENCHSRYSIFRLHFLLFLVLALFISGCGPRGPRALMAGKKLLDRGDYAGAVAQLKTAATLLLTNAQAWNYYGVALQHSGQPEDAVLAYQSALKFDRDLMEVHYNLGCLWLEQNKPGEARTEFTAYTLRRNNAPEGWIKLGMAQLHAGDLTSAEKCFNTALSLSQNNSEALNGLGLAYVARGHPQEAAKYFSYAVDAHPDYAPALLNLATVNQQYLRDGKTALKHYHAYLELTPRPADWNAVNDLVQNLEQPAQVAVIKQPIAKDSQASAPAKQHASEAKPPPATVVHTSAPPATPPSARITNAPAHSQPTSPVATSSPPETVAVTPGPVVVAASDWSSPQTNGFHATTDTPAEKPSVWHRLNPVHWFGSSSPPPQDSYVQTGVTPLASGPGSASAPAPTSTPPAKAVTKVTLVPPAPPTFPRYLYLSPHKPKAGDRRAAGSAFDDARLAEQKQYWTHAMDAYRRAAELDPSWFEAQFNYGVIAYRLGKFDHALTAYEMALALQPDSVDARYNFALALKAAGFVPDAANELKKVVATQPNDARAHLALGNLYAQQLRDPAEARQQYLKLLELDPHNSQATDIRFWLSENPP
jgi:tetratricopeptide (TPR) repeat protein